MADSYNIISSEKELTILIIAVLVSIIALFIPSLLIRVTTKNRQKRDNADLMSDIEFLKALHKKYEKASAVSAENDYKIDIDTDPVHTQQNESDESVNPIDPKKQFDNKIELLIINHHEQALREAKIQFWFSLVAACIGFVIFAITVFTLKESEWYNKLITTISGLIFEVVSGLFFSQSKETRERSSDFLNRLREDRKFEKGIEIANTITDVNYQNKMLAVISLSLCGINNSILLDSDNKQELINLQTNDK